MKLESVPTRNRASEGVTTLQTPTQADSARIYVTTCVDELAAHGENIVRLGCVGLRCDRVLRESPASSASMRTRADDPVREAAQRSNFDGSFLGCINEKNPGNMVSRSQLDEICLLVHSIRSPFVILKNRQSRVSGRNSTPLRPGHGR